nr:HAMP domain-containing sensor histidine kinase [Mycolicibacterium rhodesiae]
MSRQLMVGVCVLVTVCVLGVGALSVYSLQTFVVAAADDDIARSLSTFEHSIADLIKHDESVSSAGLLRFTGQGSDTMIAIMRDGRVVQSARFDNDGPATASAAALRTLEAMRWTPEPQTVDFGAMGKYRVGSIETADGQRLISAVSMRGATQVLTKKTLAVGAITAVAALVAAVGTVVLVRQALRPLRRVAATAARAANISLAADHQPMRARVPRAATNPDNEVGIVGEQLNRLLANVDSALASRAESDRRMRRFISDASHELRTPLATILGYAQLTRQDGASLPPTTEYALGRIESESRRMSALVADMLLLSRLDEGHGLDFEDVDITTVVRDAVNDVAVTASDHRFVADLPDDELLVRADRASLHQIVVNLLNNARIHTPAGVTVNTELRSLGGAVELSVTDNGPGVDPSVLADIFGRFVRANTARSREMESSGLGLAIAEAIAEAHGGCIGVESRAGFTRFTVRLPALTGGMSRSDAFAPLV